MDFDSFCMLVALLAMGAAIGIVPIFVAAQFSSKAIVQTWLAEVVLFSLCMYLLGTSAWTDQSLFNEPGEWMAIQAMQIGLLSSLVAGTVFFACRR